MKSYKDLRVYYPAVLVLIAVLLFTIFSFYELKRSAKARRTKLFELYTQQTTEKLQKRIVDYTQILRGCQSLFYSSDSVTSREWRLYSENLQLTAHYPGIQGIAFAKYIRQHQRTELESLIRRDFPYFKIQSPPTSVDLTPIIFIEPKDERNLRAFGFDMFSEQNRREAMIRALKTGEAAMTHKIKLLQETSVGVQPGFILYLAVYRNPASIKSVEDRKANLLGFVYIPFRAHDLMNAVFKEDDNVEITVYDQDKLIKDNLLFRSTPKYNEKTNKLGEYELSKNTILQLAGNKWLIHFSTDQMFGSPIERSQPQVVLVFGMAISILLYLLTINYINKRQVALEELDLAREIEQKKDEFIGIASHELKTPLTSIKAYLQMLGRSNLGEREKHFVSKATTQTIKLNSLIADLLDVSKIQAGSLKLNVSDFELSDLVNESIESVMHMYQSHIITKPSSLPQITMTGDKIRLEQALINLLVNAIKYSPGKETVSLNLSVEAEKIVISVQDFGIGISNGNQSRIFEKFYRAEELSPVFSGLGMGLFISYEIVRRHNGIITVKSELGKGSTFSIVLPYLS